MRYDPPFGPYGPYGPYGFSPYQIAVQQEKREIRRASNRLGWAAVAGVALMSALSLGGVLYFRLGTPYDPSFSSFDGMDPVLYYFVTAVAYVLGLAAPVLLYFAVRRIPLAAGLPFEKAGFLKTAALVFLGSFICLLANFPANIVVNLEQYFGFSGNLPEMPLNDDPAVLALYTISIVVIPPIVEEMMFRGMILQGLRRFGDGFAVVASAALFGLYHANLAQMVFAFLCGLALGFAVIRSNSLLPAILIHLVNNASSVFLELVERYQGTAASEAANNIRVLILFALGILSVLYLLVRDRRSPSRSGPSSPLRFSAKLGALFWNPSVVVLTLYALAGSVMVLRGY